MASFAIVSAALVVRAVVEFGGPQAPEGDLLAWNSGAGNPLKLAQGEQVLETDSTGFRGRYAGIGYAWDEKHQLFVPPQPYPSWTLDLASDSWQAPVSMPADGRVYAWNEKQLIWEPLP